MGTRDPGRPLPFSHYDRRHYRTVPVEEGYAAWSKIYGDGMDRFDLDLLGRSAALHQRVRGAKVADLACGTGRIGAWLMESGARSVWGVDRSLEMMAGATARGVYAEVVHADLTRTGLPGGEFDGITCSMALCHVEDLGAFFTEARRLLRPSGWLAVIDYHPVFLFMGVPSHFNDPDTDERVAIDNHIHPLRDFFQLGQRAGMRVLELEERFVDEPWVEEMPSYRRHLGLPITHYWLFEA